MRFLSVFSIFVAATLVAAAATAAAPNLWQDIKPAEIKPIGPRLIQPLKARTFKVDIDELDRQLRTAPVESAAVAQRTLLTLPMPEGKTLQFRMVRSTVMQPGLAAKYPQIRTYAGTAVSDPTIAGRFDLGPRGFHGQIFTPQGTVYIDPYSRGDRQNYQVYFTRDMPPTRRAPDTIYKPTPASGLFQPSSYFKSAIDKRIAKSQGTSIAGDLRTYRLALAADYEYSSFQDPDSLIPDKAIVLAELVNVVNRVTGVYEREIGVRLVLVDNNDAAIFNTPVQPYVDSQGIAMLEVNTTVLNALIGPTAYDIGHVASTGGGGVAGLGVVCSSLMKGAGVTGLSMPIGDAYYIDYVAHEMGHQFGANHPFNSELGSCGGGNRNEDTAYEPGSGITIMAYAGICDADDLAPHSIDKFHAISFDEIIQYTRNDTGNDCAVISPIANRAPIAVAPAGGFSIPRQTPFELTGSGSDPDGDTFTYQWEEFDKGEAGTADAAAMVTTSTPPLFRSFLPVSSPTRTFPQLSDLLSNTHTIGEILPAVSRTLHFRLTLRDNKFYPESGGVGSADLAFLVTDTAGPFLVTFPNDAQTFDGGQTLTTTWDVANTTAAPVSCAKVDILLSTDGGNTFPTPLLAATPNDGSEPVTLPDIATTTGRIKVKCSDNVFFDLSNTDFSIQQIVVNTAPTAVLLATPVSGPAPLTVTLDGAGSSDADAGDSIARYAFDFGDGSPAVTQPDATVQHVYANPGSYTAALIVGDTRSALSTAVTTPITVSAMAPVNIAPTARLTATPSSGIAPLSVSFDASASSDPDSDDRIASYTFDFGDGGAAVTQTGAAIKHVYAAAGTFVAKLTVVDTHSASSMPALATITSAAAPAPTPTPDPIPVVPTPAVTLAPGASRLGSGSASIPVLLVLVAGAALRRRRNQR